MSNVLHDAVLSRVAARLAGNDITQAVTTSALENIIDEDRHSLRMRKISDLVQVGKIQSEVEAGNMPESVKLAIAKLVDTISKG